MGRKKSKFTGSLYLRTLPPETVIAFKTYCKDHRLTQAEAFADLITFAQASKLMKGFDDNYFKGFKGVIQ